MTLPVLILRPQPGADETARRVRDRNMHAVVAPLFAIEPLDWTMPDPSRYDALLVSSRNSLRLGGAQLAGLTALPVLAVGAKTAEAARAQGFSVAMTGEDGLAELMQAVDRARYSRLLRLAGEDHILMPDWPGQVELRILYRATERDLPAEAIAALMDDNVTLLHSPRAAFSLRKAMQKHGLAPARTRLAALSERVAEAAGDGWHSLVVAAQPTDAALLDAAHCLCR